MRADAIFQGPLKVNSCDLKQICSTKSIDEGFKYSDFFLSARDPFLLSYEHITNIWPTTYFVLFINTSVNWLTMIYQKLTSDEQLKITFVLYLITVTAVFTAVAGQMYGKELFGIIKELDKMGCHNESAGRTTRAKISKITREYNITTAIRMLFEVIAYLTYGLENRYIEKYILLLEPYLPYLLLKIVLYLYYATIFFALIHLIMIANGYSHLKFNLRVQLLVVNHLLENIDKGLGSVEDELYQKRINRRLKKVIKRHQEIYRIFLSGRHIFDSCMCMLVPIGIIMSVGIFNTHLLLPSSYTSVAYFCCTVCTTIAFIHHAQTVVDESLRTSSAAMLTQWHRWDRRNRMILLNLLVKVQKPMVIHIGEITVTYRLAIRMLRTAYSFCCMIYTLHVG